MRRLGLGLICAGLIALLMSVFAAELGGTSRGEPILDISFYAGAAMCGAGVLLIVVRRFMARRGI